MKKIIPSLIFVTIIISCKSSKLDYETQISNKEIYEFMNFALKDLKISDTVNIQSKPIFLFQPNVKSNGYEISDFLITESGRRKNGIQPIIKTSDTAFILNQNKRYSNGFEWNLKKLGYSKNNSAREIYLSLPFFTENRESVILFKSYRDKVGFMSSGSSIWHYEKTKTGWKGTMIRMSLN